MTDPKPLLLKMPPNTQTPLGVPYESVVDMCAYTDSVRHERCVFIDIFNHGNATTTATLGPVGPERLRTMARWMMETADWLDEKEEADANNDEFRRNYR